MELNRFEDVLGVVTTDAIVEGRFVVLCGHSETYDFGSREDLPGVKVPATSEEATRAKFVLTFAVDNRPTPIMEPVPATTFGLRGGFGAAANAPFSATVYLTPPGNQEGLTIPSGTPALAFTEGTFTLPSGAYIYSSNLVVPGAAFVIEHSGADAGKPKYTATNAVGVIGFVERYDSTTGKLTVRVE
jgi:peptidoglycan hydrolase-like protein with peptidoglycan-binding domain